tara:strand:+ start:245 stop:7732 length:7488 start_codon:yes stop_codon:yes gene_type:complete
MSKFVLTAQLRLQAPTNTRQVLNQMRGELKGLSVPVEVQGAAQAQKQIKKVTAETNKARGAADAMGKSFGLALKRFAAFTIASRAVSLFTNSLANAVDESISFQREVVKISQVTGKTTKQLQGLVNEITNLSTTLGVSSKELLGTARILSQAGLTAQQTKVALEALAKTTLAATFEDINKTAEGAVAILSQFGQGVGALERQLGSINAVAGQFAVESGDLIGAIRRTGGVFKSAGGSLEEFLGLFTSIRATTRESSESIATGLRTILTRIQRPKTIQFLQELGVQLTDINGKFIGPFKAVQQLNKAFGDLPQGDLRFVQIAEELGGFRQIGKVIPLLQQFEVAEKARQAAIAGGTSLDKDSATAQQALATQIQKTKEEFFALIRGITETASFQAMTKTVLNLASAFISVADALKPVLPLLGAFAAVKLTRGLGSFAAGIGSGLGRQRRQAGGMIHGFNRGGFVPGTGNRDTVPAMLTPGEFVIRKSSVNKIGADRLAGMNKYASGGIAKTNKRIGIVYKNTGSDSNPADLNNIQAGISVIPKSKQGKLIEAGISTLQLNNVESSQFKTNETASKAFDDIRSSITDKVATLNRSAGQLRTGAGSPAPISSDSITKTLDLSLGRLFEDYVGNILGIGTPGNRNFDLDKQSEIAALNQRKLTSGRIGADIADIKLNDGAAARKTLFKKAFNEGFFDASINAQKGKKRKKRFFGGLIQKFVTGGLVELKRAGAAILDPDENFSPFKYDIGTDDVKKTFNEFKSLPRNKDPVSKFYKKTSFTVDRKGLNKETSNRFKVALEDGLVDGVNSAASSLGSDLGFGGTKLEGGAKENFLNSVRTGLYGDLFENLLMTGAKGSAFVGSPNRPFDFPDGLNSKLSDNFSGLPSKFIDAKASEAAASQANMKTKVLGQIKQELIQDGILAADYPGKKGVEEQKNKRAARTAREAADKKARGIGFPARRKASGGGISGKDTVPALLTPGEFVINKKSAQSIGYANLSRMNTKGVVGFNKGGSVGLGVQKFRNGGGVGGIADIGLAVGALSSTFSSFIDKSDKASDAQFATAVAAERLSKALLQGIILFKIIGGARKAITDWEKGVKKSKQATEEKADTDKKASAEAAKASEGAGKSSKDDKQQKGDSKAAKAAKEQDRVKQAKVRAEKTAEQNRQKQAAVKETGKNLDEANNVKKRQEQEVKAKEQDVNKLKSEKASRQDTAKQATKETIQAQFAEDEAKKKEQAAAADLKNKQQGLAEEKSKRDFLDAEKASTKQQITKEEQENEKAKKAVQGSQAREKEAIANINNKERQNKDIDAKLAANRNKQQALTKRAEQDPSQIDAANKGQTKLANEEKKLLAQRQKNDASIKKNIGNLQKQEKVTAELGKESKKSASKLKQSQDKLKGLNRLQGVQEQQLAKAANATSKAFEANKRAVKASKDASVATNKKAAAEKKAVQAVKNVNEPLRKAEGKLAAARTKLQSASQKARGAEFKHEQAKRKSTGASKAATNAARKAISVQQQKISSDKKALASSTKLGRKFVSLADSARKAAGRNAVLANTYKKQASEAFKAMKGTNKLRASFSFLKGSARSADAVLSKVANRSLKKFERNLRSVARAAGRLKGSFGAGGRGRAAVAGAGRLATGIGGVAAMGAMLGQQISGALSEIANRQAEQAIGRGDVKGAAEAGGAAAIAEELGRAFTLSGVFQLLTDPEGFKKAAIQNVQNRRATDASAAASVTQESAAKKFEEGSISLQEFSKTSLAASRDAIAQLRSRTGKGTAADEKTRLQVESEAKKNETEVIEQLAKSATSFEDLDAKLKDFADDGLALTAKEAKRLGRQFLNVQLAAKAVAKANFDNATIMSGFNSAGVAVNGFLNSLQTGSLSLENNIATFEASLKNFGMGEQGKAALEAARGDVLSSIGGGPNSEMGSAVNRTFDRAAGVQSFMASVQSRVAGANIRQSDAKVASSDLTAALLQGVTDADIRSTIEAQVAGLGDIRGKDISSLVTQIQEGLDPLAQGALNSAKALLEHQKTIVSLTQRRRQAELAYVQAQQNAISIQLAAAKRFEEFGGAKLTSDQQMQAAISSVNLQLKDAGLTGLGTGTATDVASQRAQIAGALNNQIAQRQSGGFGGAAGIDQDRIKELNGSINGLIKFTNQRMDQIKTEIALIDKKNAAEKASMESLLAGDIAGFLDQQAAAGAAAALRSGNADLARLFGGDAQLAAIKSISETEDPSVANKAASIALGQLGITDPNAAGILTGTDPEKRALQEQGQSLAREQAQLAQLQAESAKMEVASAEMNIATATLKFEGEMTRQARETEIAQRQGAGAGLGATPLARGGVVYANRGIFVPRGTDTVPAMLTPGEFVVNRQAVQRGNNLQILRAMNSTSGPTGQAAAMSNGGRVGYYALGDIVQSFGNIVGNLAPSISEAASVFSPFVAAVEKLSNIEIGVSSKPVDVTVTLNGANILNVIDEKISNEVLNAVAREIPKYSQNTAGTTTKSNAIMKT